MTLPRTINIVLALCADCLLQISDCDSSTLINLYPYVLEGFIAPAQVGAAKPIHMPLFSDASPQPTAPVSVGKKQPVTHKCSVMPPHS